MAKCSYCGKEFESFQGIIVVDSISSKVREFCSGKCRSHSERKSQRRKQVKKKKWATFGKVEVKAQGKNQI